MGIKKSIFDNLHWLLQQFGCNLTARRDDLKNKNPGTMAQAFTRVIWVQMLARPISEEPKLARVWKLRRKFNDVLDDLCEIKQYMHVLPIKDMEEFKFFDSRGNLTTAGKKQFWLQLNEQIKAFEYHKTELRPPSKPQASYQSSNGDGSTHRFNNLHNKERVDKFDDKWQNVMEIRGDRRRSGNYSQHNQHPYRC